MAQKYIDFRSDTVTNPTPSMRQAMFTAEVGDDFYNDDPTAIKLQNYAAKIFNKDSSLFVPTGCFGNTCSLLSQSNRGDELILASESHIVLNERGSAAALS